MEVRETVSDSNLLENMYETNRLTKEIIETLLHIPDLNMADLKHLNIVVERSKSLLEKVYEFI